MAGCGGLGVPEQVATGSSFSVVTQAFSLQRRPGGPWGILGGKHAEVEMRKPRAVNTKACAREGEHAENAASAEMLSRPGSRGRFLA